MLDDELNLGDRCIGKKRKMNTKKAKIQQYRMQELIDIYKKNKAAEPKYSHKPEENKEFCLHTELIDIIKRKYFKCNGKQEGDKKIPEYLEYTCKLDGQSLPEKDIMNHIGERHHTITLNYLRSMTPGLEEIITDKELVDGLDYIKDVDDFLSKQELSDTYVRLLRERFGEKKYVDSIYHKQLRNHWSEYMETY